MELVGGGSVINGPTPSSYIFRDVSHTRFCRSVNHEYEGHGAMGAMGATMVSIKGFGIHIQSHMSSSLRRCVTVFTFMVLADSPVSCKSNSDVFGEATTG